MRLIDADALMAEMKEYRSEQEKEQMYSGDRGICVTWNDAVFFIKNATTIETEPSQVARDIAAIIENEKDMRVIGERKRGKWTERKVFHEAESSTAIDEWQSARCSKCGKYHTTPYLYYFTDYDYCPHCGADMREE